MIRYSLRCDRGHAFDSWFRSSDAFETVVARRELACPDCGSDKVDKALMAPPVGAPAKRPSPARAIAAMRREIEKNSDYVGDRFATEARAIHDGAAPKRSIWGEAHRDDARKLVEDGVPVAPLPFVPERKMN